METSSAVLQISAQAGGLVWGWYANSRGGRKAGYKSRVAPPTPVAFVLLVLLLPGVWLAGSAIARRLAREPVVARVLAPVLAVALWLTAIHAASLVTH